MARPLDGDFPLSILRSAFAGALGVVVAPYLLLHFGILAGACALGEGLPDALGAVLAPLYFVPNWILHAATTLRGVAIFLALVSASIYFHLSEKGKFESGCAMFLLASLMTFLAAQPRVAVVDLVWWRFLVWTLGPLQPFVIFRVWSHYRMKRLDQDDEETEPEAADSEPEPAWEDVADDPEAPSLEPRAGDEPGKPLDPAC
jgi:hypothetical protein